MPAEIDSVGIDVAFSCSQKGLSCPAGFVDGDGFRQGLGSIFTNGGKSLPPGI